MLLKTRTRVDPGVSGRLSAPASVAFVRGECPWLFVEVITYLFRISNLEFPISLFSKNSQVGCWALRFLILLSLFSQIPKYALKKRKWRPAIAQIGKVMYL